MSRQCANWDWELSQAEGAGAMRRRYQVECARHRWTGFSGSPGKAFRRFLRGTDCTLRTCAPLARFKYWLKAGGWSPWCYQDPHALVKEP